MSVVIPLLLLALGSDAEPLPIFFQSAYGDARDVIALTPRKFQADDPAWQPQKRTRRQQSGSTSVVVHFPAAAFRYPVRFGIPLDGVASSANVALFDEEGRRVDADIFPLVNFATAPQSWVMIATVLDAPKAGDRTLTVRWGPDIRPAVPSKALSVERRGEALIVRGNKFEFQLSPSTLVSHIRSADGSHCFASAGTHVGFRIKGESPSRHQPGKIRVLFDGKQYKRYRIESWIADPGFKLHFEVETWADSPYLFLASRLINETPRPVSMNDLRLLSVNPHGEANVVQAGLQGDGTLAAKQQVTVVQRRKNWAVLADGKQEATGIHNDLGQWVSVTGQDSTLTLVVPDFQGFGPGDPDLSSQLRATHRGVLELAHYQPYPAGSEGTITFWDTAARTFRMALHLAGGNDRSTVAAAPVHEPPHIRLDRGFLTSQDVFAESRVTHLYDEASMEAARYFDRARAKRQDYPRMGRGMPPPVGEGFEHPYTDSGGMLFGEVWQYTFAGKAEVTGFLRRASGPQGNLPSWYVPHVHNGVSTYRCGDQTLALAFSYLRTGDRQVFNIFDDHSLQYADWSIAHPEGYCHYYCTWHADNHVYSRLGALVESYLISGEPWFFEVAEQMGGHLVRDWVGKRHPRDQQTRSAYPGRGLAWLYEVTGHRSYWNDAVDRALWVTETGITDEGGMRAMANSNSRISPLFAGYTLLGINPIYERCRHPLLLNTIRKVGNWLLTCQGTQTEREGAGTWPRDTLLDGKPRGPGNCGATTLCAEHLTFLAQVTGEQRYFYSGAAAWANLVAATHHLGIPGGLPMQTGDRDKIGTWSDTFPEYLHRLPAVAERFGWPFVVEGVYNPDPKRDSPVVVFAGAGGRFDGETFRQPLYAETEATTEVRIWSPRKPTRAVFAGKTIPQRFDSRSNAITVTLPAGAKPGLLEIRFD